MEYSSAVYRGVHPHLIHSFSFQFGSWARSSLCARTKSSEHLSSSRMMSRCPGSSWCPFGMGLSPFRPQAFHRGAARSSSMVGLCVTGPQLPTASLPCALFDFLGLSPENRNKKKDGLNFHNDLSSRTQRARQEEAATALNWEYRGREGGGVRERR